MENDKPKAPNIEIENEQIQQDKKKYLDYLFYTIGKQQEDFDITFLSKEKAKPWKKYKDICFNIDKNKAFFNSINVRGILSCEIVIDLDDEKQIANINNILDDLEKNDFCYSCYNTGSKGYHIHLFFDKTLTEKEKEQFIKIFGGDLMKKSKRNLIALENYPHWKTGKLKQIYEEKNGVNNYSILKVFLQNKEEVNLDYREDAYKEGVKATPTQISGITEQIVSKIKLSDLALEYGSKKGEKSNKYHCPFHDDKDPSLSIDDSKGFWNCFGCEKKGNIVDFIVEAENCTPLEATKKLKEKAGINVSYNNKNSSPSFNDCITSFIKENPFFYDEHNTFWQWDFQNCKWKFSDDINLLNNFKFWSTSKNYDWDILNSRIRTLLINSFKQLGRINIPKDVPLTWIQFKNKIYDFSNEQELDATPDFFLTNPLPFAPADNDSTPTIDKLFREWVVLEGVQDETYVQTLYEIVAYCCSSYQFLQQLIATTGSGANGKGTFTKLIEKFLGKENYCSSNLKALTERNFETSGLYKKLLCIVGEVDSSDLKNTNMLKQLSGEDSIRYEFKGKTPFTDVSSTTMLICTNSLPLTPDKSDGFYRRWMIVDFPHQFPIKRDILAQIPIQEFSCLARKIINILVNLYKKSEFTNSGTIEQKIARYERRSNPLALFILLRCDEDSGTFLSLREFSNEYNAYLKSQRLRQTNVRKVSSLLRDTLGYDLGNRNLDGNKNTSVRCILNLSWRLEQPNVEHLIEKSDISDISLESKEQRNIENISSRDIPPIIQGITKGKIGINSDNTHPLNNLGNDKTQEIDPVSNDKEAENKENS